jgi:hypothetical protein
MFSERMKGLLIVVLGTVLAVVSSTILLPLVFGKNPTDSASAWGLSGAVHVLVAMASVPAFWVAYGLTGRTFRARSAERGRRGRSRWKALLAGLVASSLASIIGWALLGLGAVTMTY